MSPETEESKVLSLDEIRVVLDEYHRRSLLENMSGPAISMLVHLFVLVILALVLVPPAKQPVPVIETVIRHDEAVTFPPKPPDPTPPDPEDPLLKGPEAPAPDAIAPSADAEQTKGNVVSDTVEDTPGEDTSEMFETPLTAAVHIPNSPYLLDGLRARTPGGRKKGVIDGDGTEAGQGSLARALKWLASVQNEDGSWGKESPAHTGLVLLVFLGYGETPLSETYGLTVQKGLAWLEQRINHSSSHNLGQRAYGHGIATYAIAEAYGMTRIPKLREPMEQAVQVIIDGQLPNGGFNYNYSQGQRWDLSVSGWQFQALKAAYMAGAGNEGLADSLERAVRFCRRTAYANGKFGYTRAGTGGNMTGVGTVALQLLSQNQHPEMQAGGDTIRDRRLPDYQAAAENPDQWHELAGKNLYGWYYDTQAMFNLRTHPRYKKAWKAWVHAFETTLCQAQQPEGYWEVRKGHGLGSDLSGRILGTCWSALQLEVYYRYLPTFDQDRVNKFVSSSQNIEQAGDAGITRLR